MATNQGLQPPAEFLHSHGSTSFFEEPGPERGMVQIFFSFRTSLHTPHGAQSSLFLNRGVGVGGSTLILSVLRMVLYPLLTLQF